MNFTCSDDGRMLKALIMFMSLVRLFPNPESVKLEFKLSKYPMVFIICG